MRERGHERWIPFPQDERYENPRARAVFAIAAPVFVRDTSLRPWRDEDSPAPRATAREAGRVEWQRDYRWGTYATRIEAQRVFMEGINPALVGQPDWFIKRHFDQQARSSLPHARILVVHDEPAIPRSPRGKLWGDPDLWPSPPRRRNPRVTSYYAGTEDILEAISEAAPEHEHVTTIDDDDRGQYVRGRNVRWWYDSRYVVEIEVDKIHFMEGNLWNVEHAAGVLEAMRHGETFEVPAARVHRITAADVKSSEVWAKKGELEYQLGMTRPWTRADIGTYSAQLVDGNHRAAAAMILGESTIPVYVGSSYREQIRKKDWL